jgi:hypothetical protein
MMKPMTWSEESVRVECLGCGAHTTLDWDDYLASIEEPRSIWCSTCADFHTLTLRPGRVLGSAAEPAKPRPALH